MDILSAYLCLIRPLLEDATDDKVREGNLFIASFVLTVILDIERQRMTTNFIAPAMAQLMEIRATKDPDKQWLQEALNRIISACDDMREALAHARI